jgi:uncharacterized membrane protein HdeD (DUF308 family)
MGTEELKRGWGWLVGVGIALIILGLIALYCAVTATMVSVDIFGWLLVIGGVLSLVDAFVQRRWGGFFMELFAGILYIIVGLMVVANTAASAVVLTLVIAVFLLIDGVFRIVTALSVRFPHWPWMLLNGVIGVLLGIMIWRQWPWSGLWVIGLFVGIELILYGWSLVMLGSMARSTRHQLT